MKNKLCAFIIITLLASLVTTLSPPIVRASPPLTLTVETNKEFYYLRENINIYGNLTLDGSPIQNELVALEVHDPVRAIVFRTLQAGTPPPGVVTVVDLYSCADQWGTPKNRFKVGTTAWFKATVKNNDIVTRYVTISVNAYDGNNIPLGVGRATLPVSPGLTAWLISSVMIPEWAYIGNGTVYASAWDLDGVPFCPERSAQFEIIRSSSGLGGSNINPIFVENQTGVTGAYNSTIKLSPEPLPGTYTVYVTSSHEGEQTTNSTTFVVEDTQFPPQASFTYSPPTPYMNQNVTFDASGSTAEGYGDYLVSYEWDFGDGTPKVVESDPVTTHVYATNGTYTVTLNVTDSEGLWCTTSKPITILPPSPPTAIFTYSPPTPAATGITTFNATLSEPGYNGTDYVPIVSYEWDFGDGTPKVVESDPVTTHVYATNGTYTVTLNVTDAQGLWDTTSQNVTVLLPYGPTANFTYLPTEPFINGVVIFDASISEPGWNGTTQPIVSYEWDFGDNTSKVVETDPITTHVYTVTTWTEMDLQTWQMNLQNTTFLNLTDPIYGGWNETSPVPSQTYNLTSWVDTDTSGNLTVGDRIDFNGTLIQWNVVTLDYGAICNMTVSRWLNLSNPITSKWHELSPVYCQDHNLTSWIDTDTSGNLTVGDKVDFQDFPGVWWNVVTLDYGAISNMTVFMYTYTVTLNVTDAQGHWNITSKTLNVSEVTIMHDIVVTSVTLSDTQAYPTWINPLYINVTIKNNGTTAENFTVTAYYNNTAIDTQTVTNLLAGNETTLTFTWSIPSIPKQYPYPIYVISANASVVPGEIDTTNNHLSDGAVTVRWPGDADRINYDMISDGHVNFFDLSALASYWYSIPYYHPWVDFNMDGNINFFDLSILATYWYTGPLD